MTATASSDTVCEACPFGTYSDVDDSSSCKSASTCPAGEGAVSLATATSDTVCSACSEGYYSSVNDTSSCNAVTSPASDFYIVTVATADSDNVLAECSTCDSGYEVSSACTETSDTVCTLSLVYGCTDSTADNYNSAANTDDGSCVIPSDCVGSWSDWGSCSAGDSCESGTQERTFTVSTAAVLNIIFVAAL